MASLNNRRSVSSSFLKERLSAEYSIVSGPDHPLLIEGPDILAAGDGTLVAVYLPKASELRSVSRLRTRFILSRLALPSHTRHVLLLGGEGEINVGEQLSGDFAAVLHPMQLAELPRLIADRSYVGPQRELPREIVTFAYERFADLYNTTMVIREVERKRSPSSIRGDRVPFSRQSKPSLIYASEAHVRIKRFEKGKVTLDQISTLMRNVTSEAFALDNGVPYPISENDSGVAISEALPTHRGDPDKILRAAAFGGWAFVDEVNAGEVGQIAGLIRLRRLNRRHK